MTVFNFIRKHYVELLGITITVCLALIFDQGAIQKAEDANIISLEANRRSYAANRLAELALYEERSFQIQKEEFNDLTNRLSQYQANEVEPSSKEIDQIIELVYSWKPFPEIIYRDSQLEFTQKGVSVFRAKLFAFLINNFSREHNWIRETLNAGDFTHSSFEHLKVNGQKIWYTIDLTGLTMRGAKVSNLMLYRPIFRNGWFEDGIIEQSRFVFGDFSNSHFQRTNILRKDTFQSCYFKDIVVNQSTIRNCHFEDRVLLEGNIEIEGTKFEESTMDFLEINADTLRLVNCDLSELSCDSIILNNSITFDLDSMSYYTFKKGKTKR